MIYLETQEAGTGKWFPIVIYYGTPQEEAEEKAETLQLLGLYARIRVAEETELPGDIDQTKDTTTEIGVSTEEILDERTRQWEEVRDESIYPVVPSSMVFFSQGFDRGMDYIRSLSLEPENSTVSNLKG